jgi:predicted RNA polymerase sigma factor
VPAGEDGPGEDRPGDRDDTLTLLFLCCHPALTPSSQVALTLRAVGGLTTAQIGRAFLVPEATMAQRISRAKQRIKAAGASFELPSPADESDRMRSVLRVLYLMFNEGYAATSGRALQRVDLVDEAIRLTRMVHRQRPDDGEVTALLALMLLTDARRVARTDAAGELVTMADQDRSRWDRSLLEEGLALVDVAVVTRPVGEYQLQAAIAAVHARAPRAEDTDWRHVHSLYELLEQLTGSPVVRVNRAVAAAMEDGPQAGLQLLDGVDDRMRQHHRYQSVRGHLLEQAGDLAGALACFQVAASRATSVPEHHYLAGKIAGLNAELAGRRTPGGDSSGEPDARVDEAVDDVDSQVGDHDQDR